MSPNMIICRVTQIRRLSNDNCKKKKLKEKEKERKANEKEK